MPKLLLVTVVALILGHIAIADQPAPLAINPEPAPMVVGSWTVTFSNGVVEVCEVQRDGKAAVSEPLRTSPGKAERRAGQDVIVFDDGRVERWTVVGTRRVVEHFFPADQFPAGTPVLGIAERLK